MKSNVLKYVEEGDDALPSSIHLEAENQEEEELLDFMHKMNEAGGLVATIDKVIEMVEDRLLVRVGDEWQLRADRLLSECQSKMMYG